jgi:uncharacterized protein (TIGR04255 family)
MNMFSSEERCLYQNNQLGDVICQLRFPEILTIAATVPAAFQEAIRDEFPQYTARQEAPAPKLTGAPGNFSLQNQPQTVNYQFTSADGNWRVNLTSKFISLACRHYTGWEDFAKKLDKPLAAFIKTYRPAYFERVGLRYLNFISRRDLQIEDIPFVELISPCYLGPLAEEEISEQGAHRCTVEADLALRGSCRVKLHAGPGKIQRPGNQQDQEVKFIFDMDLYCPGKVEVNYSVGALQMLHNNAYPIFRGAISERLHRAMEPISI